MKNDVMPSIVQMEPDILKNLVKEVKETVAAGIVVPARKARKFSAADLWNIHRNARTAQGRLRK